ncbi:hypothetical protein FRB93_006256 [Tulasnella sp. JGI-2019a]|nr:hypothetical protein FRB93_006256 [Tulasnella sp. JGI-2019a]
MDGVKVGVKVLSTVLNAAPIPEPLKSAVTAIPTLVLDIVGILEGTKQNVDDAAALVVYISDLTILVMRPLETKPQHSLDKNAVLGSRIGEFTAVLEKIKQDMSTLMSRRRLKRLFTYANDTSKLAEMKRRVDEASRGLQLEIIVTTGHEVDVISQEQRLVFQKQEVVIQQQYLANQQLCLVIQKQQEADIDRLIELLGDGDPGAAKKRPCLDGTRIALLERITQWIEEPLTGGRNCFSLFGVAGSGKSSIAASIANQERKLQRLGGRFHFTRDEQARNTGAILALAAQIALAIGDEPDIAHMTPDHQFQKLIQEPLETLDSTSPVLVIVLDALDECDPDYASSLLRFISKGLAKLSAIIKFFITSRAEPDLLYHYKKESMSSRLEIHNLGDEDTELVERDIEMYLKEELPEMVGPLLNDPSAD